MGKRAPPSWASGVAAWAKVRAWVPWWRRQEESVGRFWLKG